jgi:hypothetical protein
MVGSNDVLRGVSHLAGEFHVLVPNEKGYEASQAAGARAIAVFASASEGLSRANINCTVAESIDNSRTATLHGVVFDILDSEGEHDAKTALGCPTA